MLSDLIRALRTERLDFVEKEPLAAHTTFKIGGPAAVFCMPASVPELVRTLELCRDTGVRRYLLGNGSNMLFSDKGFDGAVISLCGVKSRCTVQDGRLTAGAGERLVSVCREAERHSLTGLEFAYGIPGTVGGAVYMNAGAYGGEMRDALESVTFLDEYLRLVTLPVDQLALGYRTSVFERQPWCILEATFRLSPGDAEQIRSRMEELMERRRSKQPLEMPSAGSTFKRPEGAFAGSLIEQCGLRGYSVGGAQISEKHCGFVVNKGGATCADVIALTEEVRRIVEEKTGFVLEREIRVVE